MREVDPACGSLPAKTEPDVWKVVFRNRLLFDACLACWMKWPDEWKHFPVDQGHGHVDRVPSRRDYVTTEDILALMEPA
jgi:hypothetical protein